MISVMICDDIKEIRDNLKQMIDSQEDMKVVSMAETAEEAIRSAREKRPDVILMDVQMPVMNGYDATKTIRSLDREDAKEVPIIAMTANAFTEDRIRAKEAGMDEHIAKPVDAKLLVKVIYKLVDWRKILSEGDS